MNILAIETSCDETAAAILSARGGSAFGGKIENCKLKIVSNIISSQVDIHRKYGGIVPEVAARAHIEKIIPVLHECLANLHKSTTNFTNNIHDIRGQIRDYSREIDLVAVTNGPGLITSLLVGVETAKTLAYVWRKPLMPINHLVGHIYASFIQHSLSSIQYPVICLIVSGGHTELVLMNGHNQFQKIGQTLDDAAGECFDKVAKLLDVGYPGGPAIAVEAAKADLNLKSKILNLSLPRPMIKTKDYNFSFSGLKTAVLYTIKNKKFELADSKKKVTLKLKKLPQKVRSERKQFIAAVCAEVQQAVIDVLIMKTIRAARDFGAKTVILCGGVAANDELRRNLELKTKNLKLNFLVPPKNLCTDNAAMIAAAAYFQWQNLTAGQKKAAKKNWQTIEADSNLEIGI